MHFGENHAILMLDFYTKGRDFLQLYDISQEIFGCKVYPGDPSPKKEILSSMDNGNLYNLTAFSMCAHNGTHVDAPAHFLPEGRTVDALSLENTVGQAYVAEHSGILTAEDAEEILRRARGCKRILLKGSLVVSFPAAERFAREKLLLLGNESQTVGPEDAPMEVHKILLGAGTVLLEGIRLQDVDEGTYFLFAAPLSLAGADGAPCRAILVKGDPS